MARIDTTRSTTSRLEVMPLVLSMVVALLLVVVVGVLLRQALGAVATHWEHAPTDTPSEVVR